MGISRKDFLRSSSLIAGGLLLGVHSSLAKVLQQETGGFKTIKNNFGIFTGQGGTIFWYASDDAAIVIDTQNPESAKNFMNVYRQKTSRKLDVLCNTHHHADHTAGNFYFKDFTTTIVAQQNCPVLQKKAYGGGENAEKQVYANATFRDGWKQDFGKEKISGTYLGGAHTGGDAIFHLENSGIAHVGDLVFNRVYPFIDQNGGGSVKGWIEVLEKAEKKYDNSTLFVFGHADSDENVTGKRSDLTNMKNYMSALLDYTGKQIKAGKSLDEIKKTTEIPGIKDRKERWAGALAANLDAAYNELKKS